MIHFRPYTHIVMYLALGAIGGAWLPTACDAGTENRSTKSSDGDTPPNVVFILADDLGYTGLSCMGSHYYETPHIDRLAREGMTLTSFYANPNCAPTRACLMTGQYAPRTGIYTVGEPPRGRAEHRRMILPSNQTRLPLDRTTLGQVFGSAGYATAMFGKWHLGNDGKADPGTVDAYHPARRGFDEAFITRARYFEFRTNPPMPIPEGAYLTDFLTDHAVDFIERHKDRPFFLYLPHFAIHTPLQAKTELIARFEAKPGVGGHNNPVYAAMTASLDESVGRILATLDRLGLADRTLVVFASDNGGVGGYTAAGVSGAQDLTDNAPLRGGKGMLYEGGVRVPCLVRYPPLVRAGTVSDVPASHVDWMPTFLELSGARRPDQPLDGVSLLPLLSDPAAELPRDALFWHFPFYLEASVADGTWRTAPAGAIRLGDFKLIEFFETGRLELYNLRQDIGERRNLAEILPERTRELHSRLVAWRESLDAPMPKSKD